MMKTDYNAMSLQELEKKLNDQKTATGIFIGSVIVMAVAAAFITIEEGFGFFTMMPLLFLPILIQYLTNLKKIKKALEEKKNSSL